MQCSAVQCGRVMVLSAKKYCAVQCSAVHCTARSSAAQYSEVFVGAVQGCDVQCKEILCSEMQ